MSHALLMVVWYKIIFIMNMPWSFMASLKKKKKKRRIVMNMPWLFVGHLKKFYIN